MADTGNSSAGKEGILVVDDDQQIADLLALMLESDGGYAVTKANSPEEASRLLASRRFELIILDVNLPGMSGLEFMKIVRRDQPYIEIIIISGEPQIENAVSFVRAGAFDFLPKPVSKKRLIEKSRAALDYRRERLELDLAKTAQFMVEERPLAKYVLVKPVSKSPLCEVSLLERDFDSFILRSYRRLAEMSPRPEELAASFLATVQRMQALDHPNIVKIFEHGFQDGGDRPYVVVEHLRGRTLRETLDAGLEPAAKLRIVRQIASALAKMHEASMLIGAMSFDHIIVEDETFDIKLVDFGLSCLFGFEARKLSPEMAPDCTFIAPELLSGAKTHPDIKSDIFSLGALIYDILAGSAKQKFDGAKLPRPVLPKLSSKMTNALCLLLGAMLQREPSARIDSDEALSSLNVICTMPDMLEMVTANYDTPANREIWL